MLVLDFITRVNYVLRGTDDEAPTSGGDEWNYWVNTLNRKKNELYYTVNVLWDESFYSTPPVEAGTVATSATTALTGTNTYFTDYNVGDKITVSGETERTIATITSDTSLTVTSAFSNTASGKTFTRQTIIDEAYTSYSLNRSFIAPANQAYVLMTDGNRSYLDIKKAREVTTYNKELYITGLNPKEINFSTTLSATDQLVGGALYVPGYYLPADVTASSDHVPLPDPEWGVMSVAAEIASNDIVYEDKEANLVVKANALFDQMVRNNRRGTYKDGRTTPYTYKRLGGDFD